MNLEMVLKPFTNYLDWKNMMEIMQQDSDHTRIQKVPSQS